MTAQAIISLIFSIALIVLVCWGIFKRANKDHKAKTQYDERQTAVRGKGFMYGFYTMLVFQTILYILETFGITLPIAPFSLGFVGVILGATVLAVYTSGTVPTGASTTTGSGIRSSLCSSCCSTSSPSSGSGRRKGS